MAAADFDRIKKRVTEILNACPPGTFSTTLDARNKTRNVEAIEAACYEAGIAVLSVLAAYPSEYRRDFLTTVSVNHGDTLPEHLGDPASIEIQAYDGAAWREADVKAKNYQQIEAYRNNGTLYDKTAHNVQNSSLAGYADVWEGKFYFTGYAARVKLARIVRADVLSKIPLNFEATTVKLSIFNLPKAGDGAYTRQIAADFGAQGMNDLAEFKTGRREFAEVSAPAPAKSVHQE